jgi:hypothetical protein
MLQNTVLLTIDKYIAEKQCERHRDVTIAESPVWNGPVWTQVRL